MSVKYVDVCRRLEFLTLLKRVELNKISSNNGLYFGQLPILEYIIHNDGCTQKEIADKMKVTPASIATSTKRLQKAGLIEKAADEGNLRQNVLTVTEKGIEHAQKCRDSFNTFDKKMFNGFSDQELLTIKDHLDRLIANITDGKENPIDFCSFMALHNKIKKFKKEV